MESTPNQSTILHVFSTFAVGGPQVRFATIANRLGRRYRHVIIAVDNRHDAASLLGPDVDFVLRSFDFDKRRTLANLGHYRRAILASHAQRLITYNWGATEWALANLWGGIPHVHIEDGFGPEETKRQLPRRVWFRRLALARARPVVMPSRSLYRIATDVWRIPTRRLAYIPNGVDCQRYARPADPLLCSSLGLGDGTPVIGTVAALRPEKNLGRLIRAFARVVARQPARLLIVGTGAERDALGQLAKDLNVAATVVFVGHLEKVERLLGAFGIYAISSDTEQMPISLIEAMAAGLPVAAVDVGDIAIMLAEPNRPYVTAVDDGALAAAIAGLLADAALRQRIGSANAAKARAEYDEAAMIAAYDALYAGRPLLTEKPPANAP